MDKLLENRYQIIRQLADGGFGKTFLAADLHMPSRRYCAIKELKPINGNPQVYQLVKERFQREAVILEDLGNNSRQIPTLYAHFISEENFYLVQEYIEGDTLAKKVKDRGKLSESVVREVLIKLLLTLEYVHSQRIIHRDIKPENIILRTVDDTPVLIDFGAVREIMGTELTTSGHSTRSIVIGTPGYMPSEQAIGRPVFASDLYALGLTAIFLLTGKPPADLEVDPMTGKVNWQQDSLNVSSTLAAVLDKAIEFHLRDRFTSAREMLQALEEKSVPSTTVALAETSLSPDRLDVTNIPQPPTQIIATNSSSSGQKISLVGSVVAIILAIALGALAYIQIKRNNLVQTDRTEREADSTQIENNHLQQGREVQGKLEEERRLREQAEIKRKELEAQLNQDRGEIYFNNDPSQNVPSNTIDVDRAAATVKHLYYFLSNKDYDSAIGLYSASLASQFDGSFFDRFERVTVDDLEVVSQTGSSVEFVGYNTYFYPDGSTQQEQRSYLVTEESGVLKLSDSQFIKVTKFR